MEDWIYIKSDDLGDAYALSSILYCSEIQCNIVRKSSFTSFFEIHPNVKRIGFPIADDNKIVITKTNETNFNNRCLNIARQLSFSPKEAYIPYIPKECKHPALERFENGRHYLLLLLNNNETVLDLMFIDCVVSKLLDLGITSIIGGSINFPYIRRCIDLRDLVDLSFIKGLNTSNIVILTNEVYWNVVAESLNIPSILLSLENKVLLANKKPILQSSQLANLILMCNKNNI